MNELRDRWLHLPPEVEALVPVLLAELTAGDSAPIDPAREAERIETLILRGDARSWLAYLNNRAAIVEATVARREEGSSEDSGDVVDDDSGKAADPLEQLLPILCDQLELIQAVLDLNPDELALKRRLDALAGRVPVPA